MRQKGPICVTLLILTGVTGVVLHANQQLHERVNEGSEASGEGRVVREEECMG